MSKKAKKQRKTTKRQNCMLEYQFIHYATIAGSSVDELSFGHDESHPYCIDFKVSIGEKILTLHDRGICDFFMTAELGLTFYGVEAVIVARLLRKKNPLRLHVVMPHENQCHRWSADIQERFYNIHETADSVTMFATQYTETCFQEAETFMLKKSIVLLTDNDGNAALSEFAKGHGKHIELIKLSIGQ
jgi:uncharacterized phage-like protein YoqJ